MISEQSPYSGGPQVIPVITWTCSPDLPGNRSLFPGNVLGNVPVGCSGCRPLSYFRIFYGSRSIVEYITILYYRRLSELYRCFRISIHYSDPPYGVGSNTPLQACACVRTCKVSRLSVGFLVLETIPVYSWSHR